MNNSCIKKINSNLIFWLNIYQNKNVSSYKNIVFVHTISILKQRKQFLKNLINLHSNRFWHTLSELTRLTFPQTLLLGGDTQYILNFLSLF